MRKVNENHSVAINSIMLATIASYINTFATDETTLSNMQMYTMDIAHNVAALHVFNNNKNAEALHNSIVEQDTLVREYFVQVLAYLEDNNLVPAYCFVL